ncbi:hypothetical protein VPNG_04875 [Cytospora leucostoma]|uniref:GST N-terminal domain-containing protein n=1 Tax=Cytospora leucostoma TaxID=1230097 RepID=A0A423XB22_9PEZI|nr:hypothetical protein VPNG_04875 [Cytospora leucostoma]
MAAIPPEKSPKLGLNIYGCVSVNPVKVVLAAEEPKQVRLLILICSHVISIPYNYVTLDMGAGELQVDWFKTINPNGKAPAIFHVKEDGTSVTVFECAPCLLQIASEFDKGHKLSYPPGTPEYWKQL